MNEIKDTKGETASPQENAGELAGTQAAPGPIWVPLRKFRDLTLALAAANGRTTDPVQDSMDEMGAYYYVTRDCGRQSLRVDGEFHGGEGFTALFRPIPMWRLAMDCFPSLSRTEAK